MNIVLRCKTCDGDVTQSDDNKNIGKCQFCGRTVILYQIDDEEAERKLQNAIELRKKNYFDEAFVECKSIIEKNEYIVEAYMEALLAQYGINYVKDPSSNRYIPTMHRMQNQPFREQEYFIKLRELTSGFVREKYEADALEIDAVQTRFMKLLNTLPQYDIFISYKDTDDAGQRTQDSLDMEELYYKLTSAERGYRVFYSRETLKEVAGEEYEPYIFAALTRAKLMILYGSDDGYIKSPWVKNEWSRYLYFLKKSDGSNKKLLPVLRNVETRYLPDEIRRLQAFIYKKPEDSVQLLKIIDEHLGRTGKGGSVEDGTIKAMNIVRHGLNMLADGKVQDAWQAILDAEKADYTHVSVTILRIAYYTLCAEQYRQKKNKERYTTAMQSVKACWMTLMEKQKEKQQEEQDFYEKLDSAEAYAILVYVFDYLRQKDRRAIVEKHVKPELICSNFCCRLYLHYLLEKKQWKTVDRMLEGSFHTSGGFALRKILENYPESSQKTINIQRIFEHCSASSFTDSDMLKVEKYFSQSDDSMDAKYQVILSLFQNHLPYSVQTALQQFAGRLYPEQERLLIDSMCNVNMSDKDVELLFNYCSDRPYDILYSFMKHLDQMQRFLLIDYNRLIQILESEHLSVDEKCSIFDLIEEGEKFTIDKQGMGYFFHHYLCEGRIRGGEQEIILERLLEEVDQIHAKTVETYLLHCTLDGDFKPFVLQKLLSKNVNKAGLRGLLEKYAAESSDRPEVAEQIIHILMTNGLAVSVDSFEKMLSNDIRKGTLDTRKIRTLCENGSEIPLKALNMYLESITADRFDEQIMDLLFRKECRVSDLALSRFILAVPDERCSNKYSIAMQLAERNLDRFGSSSCQIIFENEKIICNLMQAYAIALPDSESFTETILQEMSRAGSKLDDTAITVDNSSVRYKKYIKSRKDSLSERTIEICKTYGVFGRFDRI